MWFAICIDGQQSHLVDKDLCNLHIIWVILHNFFAQAVKNVYLCKNNMQNVLLVCPTLVVIGTFEGMHFVFWGQKLVWLRQIFAQNTQTAHTQKHLLQLGCQMNLGCNRICTTPIFAEQATVCATVRQGTSPHGCFWQYKVRMSDNKWLHFE